MQRIQEQPKGAVLLVHGLNNIPSILDDLSDLFYEMGYNTHYVTLKGHKPDIQETDITEQDWINDLLEEYKKIKQETPQLPVIAAGFSLGALVIMATQSIHYEHFIINRMILFSPSFFIRHDFSFMKNILRKIGQFRAISLTPKPIRNYRYLPLGFYANLFALKDIVKHHQFKKLNIPTIVILDKKDEAISLSKISRSIEKNHLTQWEIFPIKIQSRISWKKWHHLSIMKSSLGTAEWHKLICYFYKTLK